MPDTRTETRTATPPGSVPHPMPPAQAEPARVLPLQGATNFRDLGGYATQDGRRVRWRTVFRSDHLGALSEADHAQLHRLGLRRVFDFRGVHERATAASRIPGAQVESLAIEPTVVQRLAALVAAGRALTREDTVALMQDTYRGFARQGTPRFAALFAHLLQSDAPLVFHCTAGKDRTGFAAALLLLALGVPREQVMHDYLLTNEHLRMAPSPMVPPDVVPVLYRVQPEFLDAAFDAIEQDHGSTARYLHDALGLDAQRQARLRSMYLQP